MPLKPAYAHISILLVIIALAATPFLSGMSTRGALLPVRPSQPDLTITLGSEINGKSLEVGNNVSISWNSTGGTPPLMVNLAFTATSIYDQWIPVSSGLPGNGSYWWNIPWFTADYCFVRATVTDAMGKSSYDTSYPAFSIDSNSTRGILMGTVVDGSNRTVSGAEITIVELDRTIHSGSNGSFMIELPTYNHITYWYTIQVTKNGFGTSTTYVQVKGLGITPVKYLIRLPPEEHITPTIMLGIALFSLVVMFSLMVMYYLRKEYLEKYFDRGPDPVYIPPKWVDDADKYWNEDNEKTRKGGNKKNVITIKRMR